MISSNMRRVIFWGLDHIRGKAIKKQMQDLEEYFENPVSSKQRLQERKNAICKHAITTTRFYQQYGGLPLSEFPVVTKKMLREQYDDFLSSSFTPEAMVRVATSGSYGTPLTFLLSKEKRARQQAEIIYFNQWAGFKVGMKHAYINFACSKSKLQLLMQNEWLIPSGIIDITWMETQRKALKKTDIEILIGYPSVLNTLAEYCRLQGDTATDFSLTSIITISETLYEEMRQTIQTVFGADVVSRYATVETGVLAHECVADKKFHANTASYSIELLDLEKDIPAAPGKVGRVVVTDLHSHAMPLIRYETGDLAVLSNDPCSCGLWTPAFDRIEGRSIEMIYNTEGERLYSVVISRAMREIINSLGGILQYQFIQIDPLHVIIKLCVMPTYNKNREHEIIEPIRSIIGEEADVGIEYVSSIPPLKSGKRPYIISKYNR